MERNEPQYDDESTGEPTSVRPLMSPYELFMLVLSVFTLVALGTQAMLPGDSEILEILDLVDSLVCVAFFGDFVRSMVRAPNKKRYFFRWGWIDLLSSIPAVEVLRWGRAARILRILRVLRGVRSARVLLQFMLSRRAESALLGTAMLTLILLILGAVAMVLFENDAPGANIRSAEDALWWATTTISTVGYGDLYPTTTEGRIAGAILMTAGVGLFAAFSGCVVAWILGHEDRKIDRELEGLRAEVRELKSLLRDRK